MHGSRQYTPIGEATIKDRYKFCLGPFDKRGIFFARAITDYRCILKLRTTRNSVDLEKKIWLFEIFRCTAHNTKRSKSSTSNYVHKQGEAQPIV